jgi:hypothetical protein
MFNNLRSGNYDNIEINMNPKRKFLYVDDANYITPSTTAGISQVGFTDDIEITNETTNPSMVLYSSTGLNPKIELIRGSRTFGNDASTDWRIQNNGSTYLSFSSGKNSVITEEMRVSETDLELNDVDLKIASGKKAQSEKYTGLTTSSNFDLGLNGDTGLINSNRTIAILGGKNLNINSSTGSIFSGNYNSWDGISDMSFKQNMVLDINKNLTLSGTGKITSPNITVSSLNPSKLVLTNGSDDLVSSSYTDTDFPRLTANNTMSGNNTFSGANIFTGGITTTTSNQVFNLNDSNSLRNLFRFYKPVYETVINNGATNPQTLATTTANGITYSNGAWSLNAYTPTNNGIVIPNGQPFYFRNQATLTTTFNTDRTNLTSAVQMITGKIIMFIFNINTNLYEFVGIVNETSVPTSNQFNSKDNSFTLPELRGNNNNILTSNGSGSSSWATSITTQNITAGGVISTNQIKGLATTGNTLSICDLTDTTSNLTINRDTIIGLNKNLNLSGTAKITTPNILVSGLTPSKIVLTDASDNLVSSLYTDSDFPQLTANNTFTGINTFTNATPILTDKIDGTANSSNTLNIGNTTDTNSFIRLNRETLIGTTGANKYLRTNRLGALNASSIMIIGDSGDTAEVNSNRDIEIIDNTKGIFTNRLASRKATLPNNQTLNIGFNDTVNYTGIISLNQNVEIPTGRNLKVNTIRATTSATPLIIGEATDTSYLGIDRDIFMTKTNTVLNINSSSRILTPRIESLGTGNSLDIGANISTGSINIGAILSTGSINMGAGLGTGSINLGSSTGGVKTNGDLTVGTTSVPKGISCNYYSTYSATSDVRFAPITTTANIKIGDSLTTGKILLGTNTAGAGRVNIGDSLAVIGTTGSDTPEISITGTNTLASRTTKFYNGRNFTGTGPPTTYSLPTSVSAFAYNFGNEWWSIWYSNVNDGNFDTTAFIQNGQTSATINTGDWGVLWWFDEDYLNLIGTPTWSGWFITTGGTFVISSDKRLKKNIKTLEKDDILDKLSNIRFIEYNKKEPKDLKRKGESVEQKYSTKHMGVIAQELLDIFPELVDKPEDKDSYLSVKYTDLGYYFNLGVQELIKENKKKDKRIKILEDKVLELENKTNISTVDKVLELETKNHELETKFNNLSTELQKMKELLIFKFGDVL